MTPEATPETERPLTVESVIAMAELIAADQKRRSAERAGDKRRWSSVASEEDYEKDHLHFEAIRALNALRDRMFIEEGMAKAGLPL